MKQKIKEIKNKLVVAKSKVKEFLLTNREEIINSAINENQNKKKVKKSAKEIEETAKREWTSMWISLGIGIIYSVLGIVLFIHVKESEDIFINNARDVVLSFELIILGVYALLHTGIFCCVKGNRKEKRLVVVIREVCICLMFPYHLCIKALKTIIRGGRQEHVAGLFSYYLFSLLIVMVSFVTILQIISNCQLSMIFDEFIGFLIVCFLVNEFFICGRVFLYFSTRSVIKSVEKAELKRNSKVNWRETLNNETHKKNRKIKLDKEWKKIKEELWYTEIYFYIILTVFVLCIPKEDGSLTELLVNQYLGVATIAALGREVKGKMKDDKEDKEVING